MKPIVIGQIRAFFAGLACLMLVPPAIGESRQHGVHVHDVAEMTLVLDQRDLEIEFSGPAMSIVGFERQAQSTAEIEAVTKAQAALENGKNVFAFIGTQCVMRGVTVDVSAVWDGAAVDHGERAAQGSHAETHETHEKHEKHEESHGDISAHYVFRCAEDDSPLVLRVGTNDLPFGLEKINAKWVTDSGQGASQLSTGNSQLTLR